MPLSKQSVNINFSKGLDTKSDPFQVPLGNFLSLENTIFDRGGLLQKRNGFEMLRSLPNSNATYATTFNGNLLTLGTDIFAYNQSNNLWVDRGTIQPLQLSTIPVVRSNTNQSYADSVVASNGLMCLVFTDNVPSGMSTVQVFKYVIVDSLTGQNITTPTTIVPTSGTITEAPKVYLLGNFFIVVFTNLIAGVNHLTYFAISTANPTIVHPNVSITNQYVPHSTGGFDGYVTNNNLYIAWNSTDAGGGIRVNRLDSTLGLHIPTAVVGHGATNISVTADESGLLPIIYVTGYDSGTQQGYTFAVDSSLNVILTSKHTIDTINVANIASVAIDQVCTVYSEVINAYAYDAAIPTHYMNKITVTQSGTVGATTVLVRSVGLASKAFLINGSPYFLSVYQSSFQPTYFLMNASGKVIAKLAYSNTSGYYTTTLPNVSVNDNVASIAYLIKESVQAVNKSQGAPSPAGVYSQIGVNQASFSFDSAVSTSSEIGLNLNLPGGIMWAYDGFSLVENGFFLWPEDIELTTLSTGGDMSSQIYFYVATYEWSDNQGNLFRSAPSIPIEADMSGFGSSTCSVQLDVPTLRLTYKTTNPVKVVLYRWSTAQQVYYQVTSIQVPVLNSTTVDYVSITDTLADSDIIGNNILYTTGGVLENIAPPAVDTMTLFQSRLFIVDSEDKNLLWFSKQVIEATPVEMSDLLTIYVAPTISAQGNTGVITALSAMDDKLIIFKRDAIYYLTGTGPDNTGANSQFSEPIFITATVGSAIQKSIVLTPNGLMFQSDKGIWLLRRDLGTEFIGDKVQQLTTGATVLSAVNVPGTNQIRFTMSSNITLMYDYYYNQWGTFVNIPAVSSTLYQALHTYIDSLGQVFQESPGTYLDGTKPVLMSFTTSWLNLAGLQGYERAYFFYMLGSYVTPHKLTVGIAYDYNDCPSQQVVISPDNFSPSWGGLAQWGSSPEWGGAQPLEQWRVFLNQQKCQAFQISLQETYDPSFNVPAGAGFTMSGMDLVIGTKSGYPRLKPSRSIG